MISAALPGEWRGRYLGRSLPIAVHEHCMLRIPANSPMAQWERTLQWALFLLILLINWHSAWLQHQHDPYEFLRHGTDSLGYY